MASSKAPSRHILRGILRQLKSPTANVHHPTNSTRAYVLEQFRESQAAIAVGLSQPPPQQQQQQIEERRKLAWDFLSLKKDLAERERLQKIDTGAENQLSPREMSRRSAARAGLAMPQLNPDLK
jgi:hypothetical protein